MGFHGKVPDTQPRTARSNAEQKGANPAGFPADIPMAPQGDAPLSVVGAATTYRDNADPQDAPAPEPVRRKVPPFVVTSVRK
jgi:hypothetical protein